MRKAVGVLALAAAVCAVSGQTAGITASVSTAGANYLLGTLIPVLEQALSLFSIPGIAAVAAGWFYSVSDINCGSFSVGGAGISTDGSATIALSGMSIACSAAWSFKLDKWPHIPYGSGGVDIWVTGVNAELGIGVTADPTLHPQISLTSAALSIGDFNVQFHGSAWDGLIDFIKPFVINSIQAELEKVFPSAVQTIITNNINPRLANVVLAKPLAVQAPYNIAEIRYGLIGNPTFTSTYVGFGLQGDIVPIANPVSPPISPSTIPPFNAAAGNSYLQLQLSAYTGLSAAYTYFNAGLDNWVVPPSQIPFGLNNSAAYTIIAPQLIFTYPNNPVTLNVSFNGMPTLVYSPAGLNISAPIAIDWLINDGSQENAFTLLCNTDLTGILSTGTDAEGGMALLAKIIYLGANISVLNTNVGTVNANLLQTLVNFVFQDVVVPVFNTLFSNGIPLPSVDGLTLTQSQIVFGNGFVTVGTDFTFNPATIEEMKQEAKAWAAEREAQFALEHKPIDMIEPPKKLRNKSIKKQH